MCCMIPKSERNGQKKERRNQKEREENFKTNIWVQVAEETVVKFSITYCHWKKEKEKAIARC